jgi:drug/metabolite transporter (DMT)-like permease
VGVVLTYLLAVPLFGDVPTGWQLGGAALVLLATALLAAGEP